MQILKAAYSLPLRLFTFQVLGRYLYLFLFGHLKYSTCLILTNIFDYPVAVIWGLRRHKPHSLKFLKFLNKLNYFH